MGESAVVMGDDGDALEEALKYRRRETLPD